MLKTIFFDLGNVLVFFSHSKMLQQMAECTGLSVQAIRKILVDEKIQTSYESGQIDTTRLVQIFKARSPNPFESHIFLDAASNIFTPNTSLFPLVERLKEKGLRLVLLSNTSECHFSHIQAHFPLLKLFDDYVLSYKVGAMKPSEKIFRHALTKAQCDPKHCFYTDDIPEFVHQAKKTGLDSEIFTDVHTLKSALSMRGLTFEASF